MDPSWLVELEQKLTQQISQCAAMQLRVESWDAGRLSISMPLDANMNHHRTAFAGSLNALCTVTGFGSVYLLAREHARDPEIVIRRGKIRYLHPVKSERITAISQPPDPEKMAFFLEMLSAKGQAKLDLEVGVQIGSQPAVVFRGSYVLLSAK